MRPLIVALSLCLFVTGATRPVQAADPPAINPTDNPRSALSSFTERCGGCHGLQGISVPDRIPTLRHVVGYYLCTPEGRDYAIRLPNVAFSKLSDRELADMMNFVMFTLGAGSAPAGASPYTGAEVGRLRQQPLASTDLLEKRRAVVTGITAKCTGASALWDYQTAAERRANLGAYP